MKLAEHSRSSVEGVRLVAGRLSTCAVLTFFSTACLVTLLHQASLLFQFPEIGLGDSYVLYDVLHFQRTGEIYRDLSQPPYLPAQYSPLVYIVFSVPGRVATFPNPFLGSRLVVLIAFLLCIAVAASITSCLVPARSAWWWAALIGGSVGVMRDWVLQLRGDFFGIFVGLVALRLLFIDLRRAAFFAGLFACFATQFKITYIAALTAGVLWLLFMRQWRKFSVFTAAAAVSSAGLYVLYWTREHRMLSQMLALSPGIADLHGAVRELEQILLEPLVLLAPLAVSDVPWRLSARSKLLLLFGLVSLSVAAVTELQVGGNVNYFYEALFAMIPAAVIGVRRLSVWAHDSAGAGLFVMTLFGLFLLPPAVGSLHLNLDYTIGPGGVVVRNREFHEIADVLSSRHLFSTVPRIALLDTAPALMEPFLLTYWQRMGKFDSKPILDRIRREEFDVLVTASTAVVYRGIPHVGPNLRKVISDSYIPFCVRSEYLVHLPRNRSESALEQQLRQVDCEPVACDMRATCPKW